MNKIISEILSVKTIEELSSLISQRINSEKQKYIDSSKKHIFISPPNDSNDLSIHSIDTFLHPDLTEIFISTSYPVYSYYFDDEKEIYQIFAKELKKINDPKDMKQILSAVSESIFDYIGGAKVNGDDYTRMAMLKPSSHLDDNEKNKISVFKNSGNAWCVERAAMAQQLCKFIGLESKIIMTTISNNGEHQIHAFNLVKANGKTYLFDSAVMSYPKENEKYNAIAFTLPEDVFDKNMIDTDLVPEREVVGKSGKHYKIIYDLQNRNIFENASGKEY